MILSVQNFLINHTFKELQEQHGVYYSFDKKGYKWSLNYDMLESKESDSLSQECRGLILAAEDGKSFLSQAIQVENKLSYDHICPGKTKILAYPMNRFFNYGQGSAANINWSDPSLAVMEKLDGTLCIVYYDPFDNKWCVATRSVPEADLLMDNGIFTFRTLFEKAIKESFNLEFNEFTNHLNPQFTYGFELTTPYNRIVVDYKKSTITLISIRDVISFQEIDPHKHKLSLEIPVAQTHAHTSVSDLVNWVSSLNPLEHEGVVVRDSNFNRIKIKNAGYLVYNKARDMLGTSERNCLELILMEKEDDVIPFLPEEIVNNLLKIKNGLQNLIKKYDKSFTMFKLASDAINPGDKKTFALMVNEAAKINNYWTAPFFQMFMGKASNMKNFILQNKKDGSWSHSFLDKLLEISKNYANDI